MLRSFGRGLIKTKQLGLQLGNLETTHKQTNKQTSKQKAKETKSHKLNSYNSTVKVAGGRGSAKVF